MKKPRYIRGFSLKMCCPNSENWYKKELARDRQSLPGQYTFDGA
ncbi:hypothetical protein [Oscillatoria sp. FACHB-1406]|nr:hypothetical protein [Oscillatoria sp. FACHB-1406]